MQIWTRFGGRWPGEVGAGAGVVGRTDRAGCGTGVPLTTKGSESGGCRCSRADGSGRLLLKLMTLSDGAGAGGAMLVPEADGTGAGDLGQSDRWCWTNQMQLTRVLSPVQQSMDLGRTNEPLDADGRRRWLAGDDPVRGLAEMEGG
ncbi:hypothetical protein ACLOJK_013491 [Asimina triloba]